MVSLYEIIQHLYPDAEPEMNVEVRDGRVLRWELSQPQPTLAELDGAKLPALKDQKLQEVRRAAFGEMDALLMSGYEDRDLIFIILRRSLGDTDPRLARLRTIWDALKAKETIIQAASDEATLGAITWP